MKTILYATDRIEQAVPVLRYAHDLSSNLGADLIVFYTHQMPPIRASVMRPSDQIEHQVIEEQKDILRAYCAIHLDDKISSEKIRYEVVCNDSVLNGIIEKSKEISPDIVLIGRKDKHPERGLFAGDIVQGLLKRLACPILIVPNDRSSVPIQTMLYATDFEEADISAIKNLVPLANTVNAKIHIVHIATEKQYAGKDQMEWFKEMLKKQVEYENLEFKVIFSDHIEEELKIYSQLIRADIVALLYREEKGFFQNLFNKSLVKKLDTQISIPLISFNKAN